MAGCVFAVQLQLLLGPLEAEPRKREPEHGVGLLEHRARRRRRLAQGLAHSDELGALAGEEEREASMAGVPRFDGTASRRPYVDALHHRSSTEPHTSPAPKAVSRTRSPVLTRPSPHAFVERDRDRGGGGVAVAVDVLVDLRRVDLQALAHGVDDPLVGLVRDEEVDLLVREALLGQQLRGSRRPSP